jgi:LysM repeat protein
MSRFQSIVIVLIAALILGGGGWAVYRLYIQPSQSLRAEKLAAERAASEKAAAPDPAEVAFAAVAASATRAAPAAAQAMWAEFLRAHPDSPRAAEARAALGPANVAGLFSREPSADKAVHTVAKGDSLYKIARQHGVTVDLVAQANGMDGTMLKIGQQLVVPKPQITATVDRAAMTLRLDNGGKFLREYPLLAANIPGVANGAAAQVQVTDCVVEADGKRVTYGQNGYAEGRRTVMLSSPGAPVSGADENAPAAQLPPGIIVKHADMPEVFVLLRRGVPVTIK